MNAFRDTHEQDRVVEAPSFLRRYRLPLAIAAVVLVAVALAAPRLGKLAGITTSVPVARVSIATVERGRFVRDFAADGKIVAAGSPVLYSPSAGTVTLRVHAGDAVKRDQVLAVIQSADLVAKLSQERATLQSLSFELRRARLDAERAASEARDAHARAQVDRTTAERELERSRRAHELGAYSQMQLLRSQDALEKSDFALEQARRNLAAQPEQSRFDVQSRAALVARQQVIVDDLARQVSGLELRSPVDGQVGQLQVADRASVPRDAPLLSVVDLSQLEVEIKVPESFARDLTAGMSAELTGNGGRWSGTLAGVSPEVVDGQVVARVRFAGEQPAGLRQNQRLGVRVLIDSRDDVLTVERGSFVDQGGGFAYRVQDDVAVRTPVKLGTASFARVEILAGLKAGDRIVVSGVEAFENAPRVALGN